MKKINGLAENILKFGILVFSYVFSPEILAQTEAPIVERFAGGGPIGPQAALSVGIGYPNGIAVGSNGSVYLANGQLLKIDSNGTLTSIVGTMPGGNGAVVDGTDAQSAPTVSISDVAIGPDGSLYVTDKWGSKVYKINSQGKIYKIGGTGSNNGITGDGGPAVLAEIPNPDGIAVGPDNVVYVSHRAAVRAIYPDGKIKTVAGGGTGPTGTIGDGGLATDVPLYAPLGLAIDTNGDLLIADSGNGRIRKVNHLTGIISTVAGGGTIDREHFVEGTPPLNLLLNSPQSISADSSGNLYIVDWSWRTLRVTENATFTLLGVSNLPKDIAAGPEGSIYVTEYPYRVWRKSPNENYFTVFAGNNTYNYSNLDGTARNARIFPFHVAVQGNDAMIAEQYNSAIRHVDIQTGALSTFAGGFGYSWHGDGGLAKLAGIANPNALAFGPDSSVYIADSNTIRRIDPLSRIISTIAGNLSSGFSGDGGPAIFANFSYIKDMVVSKDNVLFLIDASNGRIRSINLNSGIVTTIAGTDGPRTFTADGELAAQSTLWDVGGIALDPDDNVVFSEISRIRRINKNTGLLETITGADQGTAGTGDTLANARYEYLGSVAIDKAGSIFVIDGSNAKIIRKISPTTNTVSTIIGKSWSGIFTDGGIAAENALYMPKNIALSSTGDLYFADSGSMLVGRIKGVAAPDTVTPPTVEPTITGSVGTNSWFKGDALLTWSVSGGSGALLSKLGCGNTTVSLDTQGTTYTCTAASAGGTTTKSVTIKRDATPPVASANPSPLPNAAGWHKEAVSVVFSGTDATSGIYTCSTNAVVVTEGANQVSASGTCTDAAGNVSAPVTYSPINVDLTAPVIRNTRTPAANPAGWNNTPVIASFTGVDALSGVAADGCSAPITLGTSGAGQSAAGGCTDLAGNTATAGVAGINIDLNAPVAAASVIPAPNTAGWNKAPATVTFTGTDALSGSGVAGCSPAVTVSIDGASQVRSGTCADIAGNTSAATSATVNLDTTAPTITLATPANGGSYVQNSGNNAVYNCADALSGVIGCLGTVPSGSAFSTSNLGTNSFTVQATDLAGNSASKTVTYTVAAPSPFTLSPAALAFGDRLVNSSTALAVTVRNGNTAALALTAPTLSGTNANQFTLTRTCGTSLVAGASCTVTATFKPTTAGPKTATFSIRVGTSTQTVPLSGNGVAVAFTVSPTSLMFPSQTRNTTSASRTVTVTNSVAFPITLSSITLGGTNSNQYVKTQTCGTSLAANSICTVSIVFKPTSAGTKTATLTVTPSGATAKTVSISGVGL